jgi:hypothetical protein
LPLSLTCRSTALVNAATTSRRTHRLPLRCADQRQLGHRVVQDRVDKCAPSASAAGIAVWSRAFASSRRHVSASVSLAQRHADFGRGSNCGQRRGRWRIPFDRIFGRPAGSPAPSAGPDSTTLGAAAMVSAYDALALIPTDRAAFSYHPKDLKFVCRALRRCFRLDFGREPIDLLSTFRGTCRFKFTS